MKDEYEIVHGENAEILSAKVKRKLNEGWTLYGDPYYDSSKLHHNQAMIKNEDNNNNKKQLND
ncbi:unnamed protein product [marine sediment metagenome]|uniref:DUF1737 domain-containing protein n=1 Tax=marine sediment metagenome TaxID=412755 RepID=X1CHY5_9ZZZZ